MTESKLTDNEMREVGRHGAVQATMFLLKTKCLQNSHQFIFIEYLSSKETQSPIPLSQLHRKSNKYCSQNKPHRIK